MAMDEERLVEEFRQLAEQDKLLAFDFMKLLSNRRAQEYLDSLEEVDEPFSEEELLQMQDTERVSLDELAKEMGWDDEDHPQQASQ